MAYNVHGGHNPSGKIACGAVSLLDESKEDRLVTKSIIKYLKLAGYTAYDCTVSNGTGQKDVLKKICTKCNNHTVDLDVSIHFNSGRNDKKGDNSQGGFEIYATSFSGIKGTVAKRIANKMRGLGFRMHGNPYKQSSNLYYLNNTKAKALLLEICFVDDKDDYNQYKKVGYDKIGKAIAEAIIGKEIKMIEPDNTTGKQARVIASTALNIRKSASVSSEKVGTYKSGEIITILDTTEKWGKTSKGWVSLKYIEWIGLKK